MNTSTHAETGALEHDSDAEQYLSFILGSEEYAVDILKVQEIRSWEPVTNIPNTPDYVLGIINLRGTVVPVIDLRRRFKLETANFNSTTVVIVVKVEHEAKSRVVGLVADAVSEVYNVTEADIRSTPDVGSAISTEFIKGLATVQEKMIILLDVNVLVNTGILEDVAAEL